MASIKDVARLAGVSDKTVSRVVNKEPNVTQSTVDRVNRAIAETGYVPNMAARMVRSSRSRTLGIITDYISTTPYSGDIVRGIQDWAGENGRTVLLANTDGDAEKEREIWQTFRSHQIEGVLYVTMYHRLVEPQFDDFPLPTVMVNCRSASGAAAPSMEPDDYQGSCDLTRFVLDRGHRKIGYIRLNPQLLGAELRLSAFRDTVRKVGLGHSDTEIRLGMEGPIGSESNRVFNEARSMLTSPDRPTAIVCGNDEIALQVYLAALGLGMRIPEDISIVGFDDFRTVSLGLKPELTTAALPYYELGYQGADRLKRTISGESLREEHMVLKCPVISRASC